MNIEHISYNGKHYTIPVFSTEDPITHTPKRLDAAAVIPDVGSALESLVIKDLNTTWDMRKFTTPHTPVSMGFIPETWREGFSSTAPSVLDLPLKFPGTDYRIPKELAQFEHIIKHIADLEETINPEHDRYHCYLTIDQDVVKKDTLHREAPCHVDGFQGARWPDKHWVNHSYTVADCIPTVYYPQPFLLDMLDITRHDVFWEFNRQVAMTNSHYTWHQKPFEIALMNAYCVHRGDEAEQDMPRTWIRMSYETRVFNRLGNGHNPLFDYSWKMVERDIEQLGLVAYDPTCDPSLRVFPWQAIDGTPNPKGIKTKPNLRPRG